MNKYEKIYAVCKAEMGIAELPGKAQNKRILQYHQATSLKATSDETPWCASFANWCLAQMGEKGTNSAAARSFMKWGKPLTKPVKGCIVVFTRTGGGHVGIVHEVTKDGVLVLGGNQLNSVCIKFYDKSRLLGYRGFA